MKQRIFTFLLVLLSVSLCGNAWGQATMEIRTADELYKFAERVNNGEKTLNAILKNNIDFTDNLLGNDGMPIKEGNYNWRESISNYQGDFDGKGHRISGLYMSVSLFKDSEGTIRNLKIENCFLGGIYANTFLSADNIGLVENCSVVNSIFDPNDRNWDNESLGFICDKNYGIIRKCYNSANFIPDATVKFANEGVFIGSICGQMLRDKNEDENGIIEECYNVANLSIKLSQNGPGVDMDREVLVGGIVGFVGKNGYTVPKQEHIVRNCYNEGDIIISGNGNNAKIKFSITVCGVIGSNKSPNIESCYNSGDIKIDNTVWLYDSDPCMCAVAGVTGSYSMGGCYNTGELINEANCKYKLNWGLFEGAQFGDGEFSFNNIKNSFYSSGYAGHLAVLGINEDETGFVIKELKLLDGCEGHATKITDEILESGEMAWALREYGYGLKLPNENNAYPTLQCFDKDLPAPAVYRLKYTDDNNEVNKEVTQYYNSGQKTSDLPELENDLRWFDKDGIEYKSGFEMPAKDLELVAEVGYNIKIESSEGGEIKVSPIQEKYRKDAKVSFTVEAKDGYEFKSLYYVKNNDETRFDITGNKKLIMPNADITVYAEFTAITHKVTTKVAEGCEEMGTVYGGGEYAVGKEVTVTATPNEGYEFDSWEVDGPDSYTPDGNIIKFVMPAKDVTITAKFKETETPGVPVSYNDLYIIKSEGAKLLSRYDKKRTPDGGSFTLSLEKEEGYEDCEPTVYYKRGRFGEWKELKLDEVSGYYQIRNVYTDIYVKVSGDGIWPVSNEEVEAQEVKVYTQNGAIIVSTPSLMDVQVISMTGSVVAADKVAGQREFRNLAEGVYIVRVGDKIVKVRL